MLTLLALAPHLPSFHTLAVIGGFICVVAICWWFLRTVSIPAPWIYVVYLVAALLAIWCIIWVVNQT